MSIALDTCASDSFATEEVAGRLGLELERLPAVTVESFGGERTTAMYQARLWLRGDKREVPVTVLVVPQICGEQAQLSMDCYKRRQNRLAKNSRETLIKVDVLLDIAVTLAAVKGTQCVGGTGVYRVDTTFGSCLAGGLATPPSQSSQTTALLTNRDLDKALKVFFGLEVVGIKADPDDEEDAEEILAARQFRSEIRFVNGKYVVPLLLRHDAPPLRNNSRIAMSRLLALERRFAKDPETRVPYDEVMKGYFDRGDARVLPPGEVAATNCYYLPHHMVSRPDKGKDRIVFNAASKNLEGLSLNSVVMKTPVLHPSIPGVLMRFRLNRIAMTADVSNMFLNMDLRGEDRKYHRFLWRWKPGEPVQHCELTRLSMGVKDSPFKAMEALRLHVLKYQDKYPAAVAQLLRNLFVDDIIMSAARIKEALELFRDCVAILAAASLPLRKWISNSPEVMAAIPEEYRGQKGKVLLTANVADEMEPTEDADLRAQALGVEWDVGTDCLSYTGFLKLESQAQPTRRSILSMAARMFDPLGYLSPFIITAKLLVQELWRLESGWDEPVTPEIAAAWDRWLRSMQALEGLSIPRPVSRLSQPEFRQRTTLHAFGDASEKALGCAIYTLTRYPNGSCEAHLLIGKSKVASTKGGQTLARKELCAAQLTAQLVDMVAREIDLPSHAVRCWTDSMTTLFWLRKRPETWKLFVRNRCAAIHKLVPPEKWRWTPGADNPADLPSRGVTAEQLVENDLWFHGPLWLREKGEDEWPTQPPVSASEDCLREARKTTLVAAQPAKPKCLLDWDRIWRQSSHRTFCRLTAMVRSVLQGQPSATVTPAAAKAAERFWVKKAQQHAFGKEIAQLSQGQLDAPTGRLRKLKPFLGEDGLLRVWGRTERADLPFDTRHPIILPEVTIKTLQDINNSIVSRIILDRHVRHQHAGADWLLHCLRDEYWLIAGRRSVRKIVDRCVACQRATKGTASQIMAPLPEARLRIGQPWTAVGVDFTGAFYLKAGPDNVQPRVYLCLFTDLVTRGIHLEVTESLTTDSFLQALWRCGCRKGFPTSLYSDEAKNFKRARLELNSLAKLLNNEKARQGLARYGVEWHLNVPHGQHRGGAWERSIRTVKETLRRVLGRAAVDLATFQTVVCEVEAFVNDRPIGQTDQDPRSERPITPSLLMHNRLIRPPPLLTPRDELPDGQQERNIARLWRHRQSLAVQAWDRFRKDYLLRVLPRMEKWTREHPSLSVGDLVLVTTEATPRGSWPLARVVQVEESRESRSGVVRTVVVRLANGKELRRHIGKLVHLECRSTDSP